MKRRRGQIIPRSNGVGARVYLSGKYEWLGTFPDEAQAEKAIEQAITLQAAPTRETVAELASRWVADYPRERVSTNSTNRYRAKRIAEITDPIKVRDRLVVLGSLDLSEVTKPIARAFALEYPSLLAGCRAMFNDALADGLVGSNPFASLRLPQSRGRADIVALVPEEVELLADLSLEVFADEDYPHFAPMFRGAVLMAAYTLIRPGELFALERSDVDTSGDLHVRRRAWRQDFDTPKNHKPRTIALLDEARDAYLSIPPITGHRPCPRCEPATCQRIFSTKRGRLFTQTNFRHYWSDLRVAFEAELPAARRRELRAARDNQPMAFYELRHVGASMMLDRGVAPADVAQQLGHSDSELVDRLYGHPDDSITRERIRRAMRQNVRDLRAVDGKASDG